LRTVFLWTSPNRPLLTRAFRRAVSRPAFASSFEVRVARIESAIWLFRVEIRPGRSFANQVRRLAVASASGSARWFWVRSIPKNAASVSSL
jgi:hypothetical protein